MTSRQHQIFSFVLLSPSLSVFPAGMCSSRGLCDGNNRSNRSSSSNSNGSGAHYALCALGLGLIALGVVMIVWTVIPMDGEAAKGSTTAPADNSTVPGNNDANQMDTNKYSTIAMVLVVVGVILLVLSISLGMRNKRRASTRGNQATTAVLLASSLPGQQEEP